MTQLYATGDAIHLPARYMPLSHSKKHRERIQRLADLVDLIAVIGRTGAPGGSSVVSDEERRLIVELMSTSI